MAGKKGSVTPHRRYKKEKPKPGDLAVPVASGGAGLNRKVDSLADFVAENRK